MRAEAQILYAAWFDSYVLNAWLKVKQWPTRSISLLIDDRQNLLHRVLHLTGMCIELSHIIAKDILLARLHILDEYQVYPGCDFQYILDHTRGQLLLDLLHFCKPFIRSTVSRANKKPAVVVQLWVKFEFADIPHLQLMTSKAMLHWQKVLKHQGMSFLWFTAQLNVRKPDPTLAQLLNTQSRIQDTFPIQVVHHCSAHWDIAPAIIKQYLVKDTSPQSPLWVVWSWIAG